MDQVKSFHSLCSRLLRVRAVALVIVLLASVRMFGAGWTPTAVGLVLNFETGDKFMLSVEIGGTEYFVCDYSAAITTDRFTYPVGNYLKLLPMELKDNGDPMDVAVWTVGDKLTHPTSVPGEAANFQLDGICYTMKSYRSYSPYAYDVYAGTNSTFKFLGAVTNNMNNGDLCDVVFAVPTNRSTDADPNHTLGHSEGAFDGQWGYNSTLHMNYREVYWLTIVRNNQPISYTNAALVTFNTTSEVQSWGDELGNAKNNPVQPGRAAYAYADNKHKRTQRTLFRIYPLNKPFVASANRYFFGWDVQNYTRYRKNKSTESVSYTTKAKIYTLDHFHPMSQVGTSTLCRTDWMQVPPSDSSYFYVGKNNAYYAAAAGVALGTSTTPKSFSQFRKINAMRVKDLSDVPTIYTPAPNAMGRFVVDTTSGAENLGVMFEPYAYFFRTSSGLNVPMRQVDDSTWITDQMWTIAGDYMSLKGEVLLQTRAEFSMDDPGAEIAHWNESGVKTASWSEMVDAKDIPVYNHAGWTAEGRSGWARIHTKRSSKNGGLEFVLANTDRHIHYDYNGCIGTPVPDSYPPDVNPGDANYHQVTVKDAHLDARFTFLGWATEKNGPVVYWPRGTEGKEHFIGDVVTLPEGTTTLYAVATYNDAYRVAISFVRDGKRYYLTHPSQQSPRLARARHFTDWTNVYQGMSDDNNSEPNYLSTYKMIVHPTCSLCTANEVVLDPRHEMVYGETDNLMFYKDWTPEDDEFIGLFYATPKAIIANDTWAGAFQSTKGWPTYSTPVVNGTKLHAARYFSGMKSGSITENDRPQGDEYVQYNATRNSFDGVASADAATEFEIANVAVADEHYVILPDTTDTDRPWHDQIVFDYHEGKQLTEDVWSELIGKKLMAYMVVGSDTTYFHPDDSKTLYTATDLRMSLDYRLTQSFQFIRDDRVSIADEDTASISTTSDEHHLVIRSGMSSPIDIEYEDEHIDIVDTLRVWLRPTGASKIKGYRGRWKTGSPGLHVMRDGSRYRDILIVTKTYHYAPERTALVLTPEKESYTFSALQGSSMLVNFTVQNQTFRTRHDVDHAEVGADISSSEDVTAAAGLAITYSSISFTSDGTYFSKSDVAGNHATFTTLRENTAGVIYRDTAIVTTTVTYNGSSSSLTARVPLMQVAMYGQDLLWSVMHDGKRYFIVAGTGGLMYREFSEIDNTLYKNGTSDELIVGSLNAENNDNGYITPWRYTDYGDLANKQLYLKTMSPVDRWFKINKVDAQDVPGVNADSYSVLTFEMLDMYVNDNANYEERVKLKYGDNQWLKFNGTALELTGTYAEASVFSWAYLKPEYGLENDGDYPDRTSLEFHLARAPKTVQTRYKAFKRYSMLLNNTVKYLGKSECTTIADLIDKDQEWKTSYAIIRIADGRTFDGGAKSSGLSISTNASTLVTTVSAAGASPTNVTIGTHYVDIVDTLDVQLSLKANAPTYHFAGDWSGFSSLEDAHLKIPLICKTYHSTPYDSVVCTVDGDEYRYAFPASISTGVNDEHTFTLNTYRREGTNTLDVEGNAVGFVLTKTTDMTLQTHLASKDSAQVRLADISGQAPTWCEIIDKKDNTVTVRCKENGNRSPKVAYLYFAYVVKVDGEEDWRYVNMRITVTQPSLFEYANNQRLLHSQGYTGDPLGANGMQQVHENKRILYYYNPYPYDDPDQEVELPVRERGFMGWWRWYRESDDPAMDNMDVPDADWLLPPTNVGKYNYPFRRIGNMVPVNEEDPEGEKKLVTMGRYTVFHIPAADYKNKINPPSKNPRVVPPSGKATNVTYVVDISNYYDNLPISLKNTNQIDIDKLEDMLEITEPTLSLREVFELHPWTEMAATLESYKSHISNLAKPLEGFPLAGEHYMEDHVMMAPTGTRLLLRTEQRYKRENLAPRYDKDGNLVNEGHSESLLGYYMHDDNWSTAGWTDARKDTMIWCGGWDADCKWFTYDPTTETYTPCDYAITVDDDFLDVPAHANISAGNETETVYYCLRARSKKTTTAGTVGDPDPETPADGDNWFNICRYKVIYHRPAKYGPKQEAVVTVNGKKIKKALITNDEIEQTYEVLERLNFDYNKPGSDYAVYPHPLPWSDASYGYSYPVSPEIPDNRYHNNFAPNFPGQGEYGLINYIPTEQFSTTYWRRMEQHGGKENGYMIYCDGMSSAGQVAALNLKTQLCQGQKIYFSGYVGNPYKAGGKACPNFTFSVQGSNDSIAWTDITSYTTGDIKESDNWYQIYFPIEHESNFLHYRVRIYNVASNIDGNDFVLDDLCLFATKPPLIAYQANTKCVEQGQSDSITNVVLRVDYQGFTNEAYNSHDVYYTVEQEKNKVLKYVYMMDGYMNGTEPAGRKVASDDLIFGYIPMPAKDYTPAAADVFTNLDDLVAKAERTNFVSRQGYIYEHIDGVIRPVMYLVHQAKMTPDNKYTVRMSLSDEQLTSSICAMTSQLKVTSLMTLELNGEEKDTKIVDGVCPNTTYEISMRVKGTLHQDNTAPIDLDGTCKIDWLLYGDTAEVTSTASQDRYGYKYSDIVKVVKDILRYYPGSGETNANLHASNLAEVSRNEMLRIQSDHSITLTGGLDPYAVLSDLVNKGLLVLYQSKQTVTVTSGNYVQYVVFPIKGTGSDYMHSMDMEVCPTPLVIKLGAAATGESAPMTIGGLELAGTPYADQPVVILADSVTAAQRLAIRVDAIQALRAVNSVKLLSTNDPNFVEGLHVINLHPDKLASEGDDNYSAGDDIILTPGAGTNYHMRQGYNYTFGIVMQTTVGELTLEGGCPVGTVMFTVSVVPSKLMWSPAEGSNEWYKPMNWIGIDDNNNPIHANARYAPLPTSSVIIPTMADETKYPVLVDPAGLTATEQIKQAGYQYNTCDKIRFMPEAAINQQQRLTYNKAVVDMKLPQEKWALRSAPVKGMIAGDIFMSNADLAGETAPWEVGEFDANGRNDKTGNASFWLSMYNREIKQKGNGQQVDDLTRVAEAAWTRCANAMLDSLYPAQGWAVYTANKREEDAIVRLPKTDDTYFYYYADGSQAKDFYEHNLQTLRNRLAGGSENTGKLIYNESSMDFTLTNGVESTQFVFGNPTMGYIDIWHFITDNSLEGSISYIEGVGDAEYITVSRETALAGTNALSNRNRYLPPMHAMVVYVAAAATSKTVTLDADHIVTAPVGGGGGGGAPARYTGLPKGFMKVTAVNPADASCRSHVLIGQGYHKAILDGEDAVLATINVDDYTSSAPFTPFNLYALEAGNALSIDLLDDVQNVPISFYMSDLPFEPVTKLWFTGVNNIDGQLVLYDALTDTERLIMDGICLNIQTPEVSYENRYYIRRQGWKEETNPVATDTQSAILLSDEPTTKLIRDGHVLILRGGHVYTVFGQKLR